MWIISAEIDWFETRHDETVKLTWYHILSLMNIGRLEFNLFEKYIMLALECNQITTENHSN